MQENHSFDDLAHTKLCGAIEVGRYDRVCLSEQGRSSLCPIGVY